ncbi:MAG: NUDIX domain-containing protein [Syntrophotaleaceae bacterium]
MQPGRWDTSVGGHLDAGEDYHSGALREMAEELGIVGKSLEFLYSYAHRNAFESENVATFLVCYDGTIHYDSQEIDAVAYYSSDEIAQMLGSGILTPNFEQEWGFFLQWAEQQGGLNSLFP